MENSDKYAYFDDGFQAEFSTKGSESELPLFAKTRIDETGNIIYSALNSCINEETFFSETELKIEHQTFERIKKDTRDGKSGCEISYKGFSSKGSLTTRLRKTVIDETEKIKSSAINTCLDEEAFISETELKTEHQTFERIKKDTSDGKNRCEICYKAFSNRSNLTVHLRIHTGERPYKCDKCKKTFNVKNNLKRHFITHTNKRPYICDTCGMTFQLNIHLKQHLSTHTKERPYACNACSKTFARKEHLKQHLHTHKVKKP